MEVVSRNLIEDDYDSMKSLLLNHGRNEWNYISKESISRQLQLLKENMAQAILAEDIEIVGFAILIFSDGCPEKYAPYESFGNIAYIGDVVVNKYHSGKGIGSKLLSETIAIAKKKDIGTIYIERHEENLASAGMMRKAGFEVVKTFYDPGKRHSGSRNTTVQKIYT
jgi:ribosomal protein S18 acetylase RimI-like enzyme